MKRINAFSILVLLCFSVLNVSAANETVASKSIMPYEMNTVTLTSSEVTFTGWGLLIESQHFISSSDHSYELEFVSPQHTFRVSAASTNITQTELMRYAGIPMCALTAYFQRDTTCYYRFENIGFSASVLLSAFQINRQYTVNLVIHANSANFHRKIPVFYPILHDLVTMNGQKEYRLASKLLDTKLTIRYASVIARKGPDKTSAQWLSGANCSSASGNQLYFKLDSVYASIKDRYTNLSNQTTSYRLASDLSVCVDGRRRIVEGSTISPVWIASSFVEYSGTPMIISTRIINTAPILSTQSVFLKVGDTFAWQNYISAYDAEEGNLSNKITIVSDNYHNAQTTGMYSMKFMVSDTYGAITEATMEIFVAAADNSPPQILATDFQILLNSIVDFRDYARASDKEDGDISAALHVRTAADISIVGTYPVCFDVSDSKGASASKCVNVKVFDYATLMARFRFVARDHLFYNESIPANWNGYIQRLINMMETKEIITSIELNH